jgi:hypothetical protein
MTSVQTQVLDSGMTAYHNKLTKSRNRPAVKPILKKLHSHTERHSLDLDRSWEEQMQQPRVSYGSFDYGSRTDDFDTAGAAPMCSYAAVSSGSGLGLTSGGDAVGGTRSVRDVSFTLASAEMGSAAPKTTTRPMASKFSHARSTSGASHASIATSNSGRNGSFVHPFQQTPRASTPPLSYGNSQVSLDNAGPRDYSPTIDEDGDDIDPLATYQPTSTSRSHHPLTPTLTHTHSSTVHPSLANQRTNSSEISRTPRMSTSRTNSAQNGRLLQGSVSMNQSRTELPLNSVPSPTDSPISSITTVPSFTSPQTSVTPQSSSFSHMSPLRTSLDKSGFRIRSRSEVDTLTRQEQVRQARRKFEEKEKAKEEKYAREQVRKQERADNKETYKSERGGHHTHSRKSSFGNGRRSTGSESAASVVRKRAAALNNNCDSAAEKSSSAFANQDYNDTPSGAAQNAAQSAARPRADDVKFGPTRRKTAKRKTTGAWTAFVLWLRTRLLKIGRK